DELSRAVSELRDAATSAEWLVEETGMNNDVARELVAYLDDARRALGAMPTQETLVAERFFDEAGGMQLIIHAPFGSRINKAWGHGRRPDGRGLSRRRRVPGEPAGRPRAAGPSAGEAGGARLPRGGDGLRRPRARARAHPRRGDYLPGARHDGAVAAGARDPE